MRKFKMQNKYRIPRFLSLFILLLLFSCADKKPSFNEMLLLLADVTEAERNNRFEAWLAQQDEYPIVEEERVYFLYKDKKERAVYITGDMNGWQPKEKDMLRIVGTEYYFVEIEAAADARIEYKFVVDGKYILDPLNSKIAKGGMGSNSLLLMPLYAYPVESLPFRFEQYTTLDTINVKLQGSINRTLYYYQHKKATAEAPFLVFNDGGEYIRLAQAHIILDNLTRQGKIPACRALFVEPIKRRNEYWMNAEYMKLLFGTLIPHVKEKYAIPEKIKVDMAGASLGGLTSAFALKDYAGQVRNILAQSPSFWVDNIAIKQALMNVDFEGHKIYFEYGKMELQDSIRAEMEEFFKKKKVEYHYRVFNGGHAWGNWQGNLANALVYLLNSQEEK